MLATLEVLRQREGFAGYIHVKLLPGAEKRYPKREFVIQYQESDLDFVSRLLEEAGIAFTFPGPTSSTGSMRRPIATTAS